MEITLTKRDKDEIVHKLRLALMKDIRAMLGGDVKRESEQPEMVSTAVAAHILGVTPAYMRQIADKYPHIKRGDSKQSKLMFVKSELIK